ncbi:mitochondrial amidoxime reducing component 2-like [Saccoglossus kowalevskii]|uniref:MOSC domain-containing protein 2, mitochondrial-like n=1 Tax=Saccoglossus kowalevskii TaxID=10224 RepID=A0ABM0GWW4_SACKO|nr:PREDICTED: MOSC domain-containing protein 2, mitochondrial-like [Saccoglossus kowalevskii]
MSKLDYTTALITGGVAICTAAAVGVFIYRARKRTRVFKAVGVLEEMYLHPIKSCRGVLVDKGYCNVQGLQYKTLRDRYWIIVNDKNIVLRIRNEPMMTLITPTLSADNRYMYLDAPNMTTLKIPIDTREVPKGEQKLIDISVYGTDIKGYYCGKQSEQWLTTYLKVPGCKLLNCDDDIKLRDASDVIRPRRVNRKGDFVAYADYAAFMLLSKESLTDLNEKLETPVSMRYFRPTLVVSGCEPFAEDTWKFIKIGNVVLRHMKFTERCKSVTVDPETGIMAEDNEPLKTLKTRRQAMYRDSPLLGVHLCLDSEGSIKLGDVVYAALE